MTTELTIQPGETLDVSLCAGYDSAADTLGHTFAILHRLAANTVDSYEGDFYHDARWLAYHVGEKGQRVWRYSFNESGTAIGTDERYVEQRNREHTYEFRLDHDEEIDGRFRGSDVWFLHVTRGTF